MARIKNTFKVTREQMELMIEALASAENWKMRLSMQYPEYSEGYELKLNEFIDLESQLRDMIGNKPIA